MRRWSSHALSAMASHFHAETRTGRAMRLPLCFAPRKGRVRVVAGANRGAQWQVESGPHSYWMGFYESDTQAVLRDTLRPGMTCLDVGAHAGFFVLLASRAVGPRGSVVAFEPNPVNAHWLKTHVALNGASNVTVVEAAVSDEVGVQPFSWNRTSSTSSLSESSGDFNVQTVSLDTYLQGQRSIAPGVVKIDVEGAELAVLMGAKELLRVERPTLLLSTHGPAVEAACLRLLDELGYRAEEVRPGELTCRPDDIS